MVCRLLGIFICMLHLILPSLRLADQVLIAGLQLERRSHRHFDGTVCHYNGWIKHSQTLCTPLDIPNLCVVYSHYLIKTIVTVVPSFLPIARNGRLFRLLSAIVHQ